MRSGTPLGDKPTGSKSISKKSSKDEESVSVHSLEKDHKHNESGLKFDSKEEASISKLLGHGPGGGKFLILFP